MSTRFLLAFASILVAITANAAVYVVPTDDELIDAASAIVIGTVRQQTGRFDINGDIVTALDVNVERVLKGSSDLSLTAATLQLVQPGGEVGSQFMAVSGAPHFWRNNRSLMFLERSGSEWRVWGMELGKFDFVESEGRKFAVRWAGERDVAAWKRDGSPHRERLRDADAFVEYIAARARRNSERQPGVPGRPGVTASGEAGEPSYVVESETFSTTTLASTFPPSAYTQGTFRWDAFDRGQSVSFYQSGSQPGYDATGAAQRALAAWTNEAGSNVSYVYAGTRSVGFVQDNVNAIVFNSASDVPSGALAFAKWYGNSSHTYKGETFYSISEGDVVVRSNISVTQKVFEEAVTHELGHTLGFRHSDQGTPSSTAAVMKAVLSGNYGATLGPWDIEAVQTVYTGTTTTPTCVPPSITSEPTSATIAAGGSVTLSVSATGTAPMNYQWFIGLSGSGSSTPISGATSPSVTVSPTATTSYWVRVANACGAASSRTVTVTVSAPAGSRVKGDLNGDGHADILWRNVDTSVNFVWLMNRTTYSSGEQLFPTVSDVNWRIVGAADFNADGHTDIVWRNYSTGNNFIWLMNRTTYVSGVSLPGTSDPSWRIEAVADMNDDGHPDLIWRNQRTSVNYIWLMNGTTYVSGTELLPRVTDVNWSIEGSGDFNSDGDNDILWRNRSTGQNQVWFMNGLTYVSTGTLPSETDSSWRVDAVADYSGDGLPDLVWRNYESGANRMWVMSGSTTVGSVATLPSTGDVRWEIGGPK